MYPVPLPEEQVDYALETSKEIYDKEHEEEISKEKSSITESLSVEGPETEPELTHEYISREKLFFSVIFMNQFFPGIPLGIFQGSLPIILVKRGASFVDLGHLSITNYPMGLKFLFGPFLDRHFSNAIGRRMSYIIPCFYIYALVSFFFAYHAEGWMQGMHTVPVSIIGFILTFLVAVIMVSTDGYLVSIIQKSKRSYMPMIKLIAQSIGHFLAMNMFIPLNSVEFCNEYIYTSPQTEPLLNFENFFYITGTMALVYVIFIHTSLKREPPAKSFDSLSRILEIATGFWKNKNLLNCLLFLILARVGFSPIDAYFTPAIIRAGFSRITFIYIQTIILPFGLLSTYFFGIYANHSKQNIFNLLYGHLILKWLSSFIHYVLLTTYTKEDWPGAFWTITGIHLLGSLSAHMMFVALGAFFARTCDPRIGSTYITITMSMANFGSIWPETIMYYILSEKNWAILTYVCWGFGVYLMYKVIPLAKKYSRMDWKEFDLNYVPNN